MGIYAVWSPPVSSITLPSLANDHDHKIIWFIVKASYFKSSWKFVLGTRNCSFECTCDRWNWDENQECDTELVISNSVGLISRHVPQWFKCSIVALTILIIINKIVKHSYTPVHFKCCSSCVSSGPHCIHISVHTHTYMHIYINIFLIASFL